MTKNTFLLSIIFFLSTIGTSYSCTSFDICLPIAQKGNTFAQHTLAIMYEDGTLGATKDLEKAFMWYSLAAQKGYSDSQFNVALMYKNAEGVTQDLEKAFMWFSFAAYNGDAIAQLSVAEFLVKGETVPQDLEKAHALYSIALENGYKDAAQEIKELELNQKLDVKKAKTIKPLLKKLIETQKK